MWLEKVAAGESGVCGTIAPYGLHTIVDTILNKIVPCGQYTIVAPLVGFVCIFLHPSLLGMLSHTIGSLFSCS
jgi:hypothetical protein